VCVCVCVCVCVQFHRLAGRMHIQSPRHSNFRKIVNLSKVSFWIYYIRKEDGPD